MLHPTQCRAARVLLGIDQEELARRAGVGVMTVRRFENAITDPLASTRDRIERALQTAGIELVNSARVVGVILRR
jgi:transcriptional regulator with XRE-family HTH domain